MMQAALKAAMDWLAQQPETLFVGQGVGCAGTKLSATFADVPPQRRLEFPVAEELQLSACLGMSLEGAVPVCVYSRWNFVLRAADALVHHLDRLPLYSDYKPRVLIRVAVGSRQPLDPGPQHADDFTEAFRLMLRTVRVVRLTAPKQVLPAYQDAYRRGGSTILVEGP